MSGHFQCAGLSSSVQDGDARRALFGDLSLVFRRGELTVLTGPSGCGKTTLLSILALFQPPDGGSMTFRDKALEGLSRPAAELFRRENIGLVFQTFRLIPTINTRGHLELARRIRRASGKAVDRGLALLSELKMDHLLDAFPSEMSGGEKQRLALVQSLMTDPPILLADEPTAALDSGNAEVVRSMLGSESKQRIVVVVTHDAALIRAASQEYSMRRGLS